MYGLRITPDDNKKSLVLDSGTRFISSLASALSLNGVTKANQVKTPPAGSTPLIIPRKLVSVYQSTTQNPNMYYVTGMSLNASGVLTHSVDGTNGAQNVVAEIGNVDVFSVAGGRNSGGYGLRISGAADFMEITDTSYLGFVTYRDTVNIVNAWAIPADVLAKGPYVVYARWANTSTPLFLNRGNNRIECYSGFGSADGSVVGGTVNNVQIVIVSCAFVPDLPASGWGLVIRNAQGVNTFSSKYPPVMWRGAAFNFPFYSNLNTGTGETLQWVGVTTPAGVGISAPMIPLCSIGFQRGDFSRTTTTWTYRPVLYSGFKMNGNSVSFARARSAQTDAPITLFPTALQASCSLPSIDAADYF